jgi:hypothetical protein
MALDDRERDRTRLPAFAPARLEQVHMVVSNDEAWSYQRQARA